MNRESLRGIIFLLVFWFSCVLVNKNPSHNRTIVPSYNLVGPLTIQEKILFGFPLPINRLSAKEWEVLPHIGPKLAQKIVDYRAENGSFKTWEELMEVSGVGQKTLESLKPFIIGSSSSF